MPPALQIVMLYDGAIGRLREARRAVEEGRVEDRYRAVEKAAAIVDALHACLDMERGGEVAALLDRLYTYASVRMQLINTRNDCRRLRRARGPSDGAARRVARDRRRRGRPFAVGARPPSRVGRAVSSADGLARLSAAAGAGRYGTGGTISGPTEPRPRP
jgi:flagellar biosynthetic protein FliS